MRDFESGYEVLKRARHELPELLSAFEFIDARSLRVLQQHLPTAHLLDRVPPSLLPGLSVQDCDATRSCKLTNDKFNPGIDGEVLLLLETSGSSADHDR